MAELASPYAHFQSYGVVHPIDRTTLKIAAAETIDITWTYNVGNNGTMARYGDQYFLLWQNMGSGIKRKLVEYAPGEGIVLDGFEDGFGVSSSIYPSWPVTVTEEPKITMYDLPIHYGVPKSYMLRLPGPLAGTTAQGGLNRPLYDFWQEVARREAFSYFTMDFGYYQLDKDSSGWRVEQQILPRVAKPSVKNFWLSGLGHQTHTFQKLFKVVWEEDR
jgi:hypothetical protein